ncbi:MAG TPA: GNAT family N-acetyltransferase [Candidatus Limnocylindrales bacterium]
MPDVLLSDGTTVHLRPIAPEDADAVVVMHSKFSERTRYLRYFSPYPRIPPRDLERFVKVDHHDREALVVSVGADLIAVGRYERLGEGAPEAEVAFVVADEYQGRGIGSVLLEHLAAAAREAGIERFVAEVLPANAAMLNVFADAGYEVDRRYADGVVHLVFPVAQTERSLAVQWDREHRTEARSVARLMRPASIAVYGASRSGRGVGAALLQHLQASGFPGPIHVTRHLEEPVDLAVVAVPPSAIDDVVADAASVGVHGLLVVTELDPPARTELVAKARAAGMRVVGPGSLGLADLWVPVNATLTPRLPRRGRVALFCQSGQLGLQLLAEADRRGLGVSGFVSVGRRADVSGNDLLQFWADDPETRVIAMYLETFGNPRKFSRIARAVGRRKPIIMIAGETGLVGSNLDTSAMEALRAHSGVIEVGTVPELFDVAAILDRQPLPAGDRIGVVSNAFPLAALASARVRMAGLSVGRVASVGPGSGPDELAAAVATTLDSEDADAVIVAVAPPLPTGAMTAEAELFAPFADALGRVAEGADKPIVATILAGAGPEMLPTYRTVEEAVRALAHVVRRAAWLREPSGALPPARQAPSSGDLEDLLRAYGVPIKSSKSARNADLAVAAAAELGFPVALKVADRPHRIDLGAVRLNLSDEALVRKAYADFEELFGAGPEVVVQGMAPPGVACVVRALDDPAFGPVVGFGLGGPVTELVGDRAWRSAPLTDRDAAALVRAPRAAPLLDGTDLAALEELLVHVGQMMDQLPNLGRLELNPVLVHAEGLTVLHARGSLDEPAPRPDTGPRHL